MKKNNPSSPGNPASALTEEDFYLNEQGYMVFTEKYHLKRGFCCKNGCRHCPYGNAGKPVSKG
ncbi:DUF5522 domain-containing protein [Pseudarcicella hirudinis]|uniref:DUF5522 domain-containing protein n=1 Tax=Pseudarcicella hirudinis TaxID=1079859 RepID=UPI000AF40A08|nr:DUF5522 domain-containing protein [Pseudarcicella hirudinis]